jgi:tetratricopeptide (TPR) repeat protein
MFRRWGRKCPPRVLSSAPALVLFRRGADRRGILMTAFAVTAAMAVAGVASGTTMAWTALLEEGDRQYTAGDLRTAEKTHRAALDAAEKEGNATGIASCLFHLAWELKETGRYTEAETALTRSANLISKADPKSAFLASLETELGDVKLYQGRYAEAREQLQKALPVFEAQAEDKSIAKVLNNLGASYSYEQRPDEAEPFFRRALALRRKANGDGSLSGAETLDNLGAVLFQQGHLEDCARLRAEAIAIYSKHGKMTDLSIALSNLSLTQRAMGQPQEAEASAKQAVDVLGPSDNPVVLALALHNLSILEHDRGQDALAEPHVRRAVAIREKTLPVGHPDTLSSMRGHAVILRSLHRDAEAAAVEKDVAEVEAGHRGGASGIRSPIMRPCANPRTLTRRRDCGRWNAEQSWRPRRWAAISCPSASCVAGGHDRPHSRRSRFRCETPPL